MVTTCVTNASGTAWWPIFAKHCQRHNGQAIESKTWVISAAKMNTNSICIDEKIIQVINSIPWVLCACGNVLSISFKNGCNALKWVDAQRKNFFCILWRKFVDQANAIYKMLTSDFKNILYQWYICIYLHLCERNVMQIFVK